MEEIFGSDVLEENFVLIVVEKNLEIFGAADPVVMTAFRADKQVLPQFRNGTDEIAVGTFCPETFGRLLFFCRGGQNTLFDAPEPTALGLFTLSFIACQVRFKIFFVLHLWLSYYVQNWRLRY
jgi:hypothetical protein